MAAGLPLVHMKSTKPRERISSAFFSRVMTTSAERAGGAAARKRPSRAARPIGAERLLAIIGEFDGNLDFVLREVFRNGGNALHALHGLHRQLVELGISGGCGEVGG